MCFFVNFWALLAYRPPKYINKGGRNPLNQKAYQPEPISIYLKNSQLPSPISQLRSIYPLILWLPPTLIDVFEWTKG